MGGFNLPARWIPPVQASVGVAVAVTVVVVSVEMVVVATTLQRNESQHSSRRSIPSRE